MVKKILLIFSVIFTFILIAACDKVDESTTEKVNHVNLSKEMLLNNIEEEDTEVVTAAVLKLNNLGDLTITNPNPLLGLLIVKDSDNKTGVWSLFENKLIIPLSDKYDISLIDDSIFGAYIELYNFAEEKTAIYDIWGNVVLEEDNYLYEDVYGSKMINVDGPVFYEHVKSLTQADADAGKLMIHNVYEVDPITKQKKLLDNYNYGDQYQNETFKLDLTEFGLSGYYITSTIDNIYNVYNEETDQLINIINVPDGVGGRGTFYNGHIFYQNSYEVNQFSENYSYMSGGKKYQLQTKSINMLTGEEKQLKVDYKINTINGFKDDAGIIKYAIANVFKIESKLLINDTRYNVILNNKGQIISDVSNIDFDSLIKLDENRIYDKEVIYDYDLNPIFRLPSSDDYEIIPSEKIIIIHDKGKFGATDYDGNVVIPFIYDSISPYFYQGKTYARREDGKLILIDLENNYKVVEESWEWELLGLNVICIYSDGEDDFYDAKVIDYNNNTLMEFKPLKWSKVVYSIQIAYGTYDIYRFTGTEGYIYLTVKE